MIPVTLISDTCKEKANKKDVYKPVMALKVAKDSDNKLRLDAKNQYC